MYEFGTITSNMEATNHLRAEVDEDWLLFYLGGTFANCYRCDGPFHQGFIYLAGSDWFPIPDTDDHHFTPNLSGYHMEVSDNPLCRTHHSYMLGYRPRDLQKFIWRGIVGRTSVEIHAERIGTTRWQVEYLSDATDDPGGEWHLVLERFFMMIDPETLEFVKSESMIPLAWVSHDAIHLSNVHGGVCVGTDLRCFNTTVELAHERGVDTGFGGYCTVDWGNQRELPDDWRKRAVSSQFVRR